MQEISFDVDGLTLHGAIFYPEKVKEKNPAILFVHGWTSKKERSYQYAKALSQLGFICMLFDMRGHGGSEGDIKTLTIKEFLDDVLAAYDFLANSEGVDKDNISAVGSSFGGYLIALLSEKRALKNLSMRVPADYPDKNFDKPKYTASDTGDSEMVHWLNKEKKSGDTYALQALGKFKGNILIIESEKDTIVPHQTIVNYLNAVSDKSRLTHILMKDAPHSLEEGLFVNQAEKILIDWFSNKL